MSNGHMADEIISIIENIVGNPEVIDVPRIEKNRPVFKAETCKQAVSLFERNALCVGNQLFQMYGIFVRRIWKDSRDIFFQPLLLEEKIDFPIPNEISCFFKAVFSGKGFRIPPIWSCSRYYLCHVYLFENLECLFYEDGL